jgi:hypothetical protein
VNLGLNFEEQWKRALAVDPEFLFVTGWNEWIAGRYTRWSHYADTDCYPGGVFVDEYTQEYSRDCEPMRGGHGDNYYYQLAGWIRRYKGTRPAPQATGPSRITIDGSFADWAAVTPDYRDTVGDTTHRDHRGYGELHYRDDTGRNDFVVARAAYDAANVSFYVQTHDPITPRVGPHWMLLFIDADRSAKTGWAGYDHLVNLEASGDGMTSVSNWTGERWSKVGTARMIVRGNELELAVPRALIGQGGETPAFDFHWADNIQRLDDVSEFGVHGDSAPDRRWNYRFEVAKGKEPALTEP